MTVSELGERALLARIQARLSTAGRRRASLVIGIGDDAAVVAPTRNAYTVLTTDAHVEGVHFDRRFSTAADVGYRALAVNLSDLAAMGATPAWALLSLVLPGALPVGDVDAMVEAGAELGQQFGCEVIGGNLTRSPGPLVVDITAVGEVRPRRVLTRSGGQPGDELWVSGSIGAAAAGLEMLRSGVMPGLKPGPAGQHRAEDPGLKPGGSAAGPGGSAAGPGFSPGETSAGPGFSPGETSEGPGLSPGGTSAGPGFSPGGTSAGPGAGFSPGICIARYLRPEPRVRLGLTIAQARAARAAMDLSDGLSDAAHQLAEASGCGVEVDGDALPIDPAARAWWEARGQDPVLRAMSGGDDYELLFAVPRTWGGRLRHARSRVAEPALTRIGVLTKDPGARVLLRNGARETLPRGFEHF